MDATTPGRLRLLFFEPKSLTREKTLSRLGFSHVPLALLGLFTQRQALDFSRSLACLFCRIRELAIAAAIASLSVVQRKVPVDAARRPPKLSGVLLKNRVFTHPRHSCQHSSAQYSHCSVQATKDVLWTEIVWNEFKNIFLTSRQKYHLQRA